MWRHYKRIHQTNKERLQDWVQLSGESDPLGIVQEI